MLHSVYDATHKQNYSYVLVLALNITSVEEQKQVTSYFKRSSLFPH